MSMPVSYTHLDVYKRQVLGCFEETKLIGFITLKPTSEKTLELYVLGILPTYHRQGIGNTMMQAVVAYAKTHGYYYLQVKTLAPEAKDEYYLKTYAFYRSLNFVDVEVLSLIHILAAQKHPEQYSSLTVRVAGYTAYFTELAGELQNEIIARTSYDNV